MSGLEAGAGKYSAVSHSVEKDLAAAVAGLTRERAIA
jgi:hypothetical protein